MQFQIAIKYFSQSECLKNELATALDNLARVYAELGNKQLAEWYIDHSLRIRENITDEYRFALGLNSKAYIHSYFGNSLRAEMIIDEVLESLINKHLIMASEGLD